MLSSRNVKGFAHFTHHFKEKEPYKSQDLKRKNVPIEKWINNGWLKKYKHKETYFFTFVGLLSNEETFFFIFPSWGEQNENSNEPMLIMKSIQKALLNSSEYFRSDEILGEHVQSDLEPSDLLISWLNFIDDYEINGELREEKSTLNSVGGRLDWAATFRRKTPIIGPQGPLFLEPMYRSTLRDSSEVTEIHLSAIQYVQSILGRFLPDYSWASDSSPTPPEISTSLDTVRRAMRKGTAMYYHSRLVLLEGVLENLNSVETWGEMHLGISRFDDVWEKMCLGVFGSEELLEVVKGNIPKGRFIPVDGEEIPRKVPHIPDVVEFDPSDDQQLFIMDAKNYRDFKDISLADITKQYAYEKAITSITNPDSVTPSNYQVSKNMLLVPSHQPLEMGSEKWGIVDVPYLSDDLNEIQIILVDPVALMKSYLLSENTSNLRNRLLTIP